MTCEHDANKAAEIEAWANQVADTFNVLPMDATTFRVWAKLMHRQSNTIYENAMIAASATVHKLTVVTTNPRDFTAFGVPLLNPFASNNENKI